MSRRYYNSPFESEKFQFTEGHFVLRERNPSELVRSLGEIPTTEAATNSVK